MIDTLLQLLDRVIQLSKYRNSKVRTVFHELVQPLFEELLVVHSNYIEMFEEATACLRRPCPDPERVVHEVIDRLKRRRVEYEPVRVKLRAMAGAFFMGSSDLEHFGRAIFYYFPRGILSYNARYQSATTGVIESLEYLISKHREQKPLDLRLEAWKSVDSALMERRERWARVCERYAKLKILAT